MFRLWLVPVVLLPAALASAQPAAPPQGSRSHGTVILSTDERVRQFQEQAGYSDATAVGGMVFLSGVVAAPRPGETGFEPAYTRAFDQIGQILGRVGCSWGDVVDITSFHTDVPTQMPAMVAVKQRYVVAPYPAWTAVGPRLTMGENIADLGGVVLALKAYHMRLHGAAAPLVDGFTGEQRFFMGWAQLWRSKWRSDSLRQQLLNNPHAPGQVRAFAPLRNIDGWYDAFGVGPANKLYIAPGDRAHLW